MVYLIAILKDADEKENLKLSDLKEFTVAQEVQSFIDKVVEGTEPATEVSKEDEEDGEVAVDDNSDDSANDEGDSEEADDEDEEKEDE